jgi:hypothetical protein
MIDSNIIKTTLLGICFNLSTLTGQWGSTETTIPIGVTNINILEAAEDNIPSFTFLSIGYDDDQFAYSGTIEDINGSTITLSDLDGELETNPYEDNELTQYPHFIKLRDGEKSEHNGRVFLVTGNKGNDITVNIKPNETSTFFTITDSIDIIRANTLESVFGVGETFNGIKGTPSIADNIIIWSSIGWRTYFCNGDQWHTFGTRSKQGKTVIYPDEGIIYVRKGITPLTLSFSGVTPTVVQSYIPGPEHKFLMGNPFPKEIKLSELIDTSSSWSKSQNISECDLVLCWSGNAWITYYFNVNNWVNFNTGKIDDKIIQSGESVFVIRNKISSTASYKKVNLP